MNTSTRSRRAWPRVSITTPAVRVATPIDDITTAAPSGGKSVSGEATSAANGG